MSGTTCPPSSWLRPPGYGLLLVLTTTFLVGQAEERRAPEIALTRTRIDAAARIEDTLFVDLDGDLRDDLLILTAEQRITVRFQDADARFTKAGDIEVPAEASAWAVVDLLPPRGAELVWLDGGGASVVPLGREALGPARRYIEIPLAFPERRVGPLRFWCWGRDLDGDHREDLLLPGLSQDVLVLGGPEGAPKGPPCQLAVPSSLQHTRGGAGMVTAIRRRPRAVFHALLEAGSLEPAWFDDDGLRALPGDDAGTFAAESELVFALRREGQGALGLLERTEVGVKDLDGDGLEDLVVSRTGAREGAATEIRTDLLFFRNGPRPVTRPSFVLLLPGVLSSGPDLVDLDGDGRLDLWLSVFGGGVRSEVARRVFRRVGMDYHVYLGREGSPPFGRSPDLSFADQLPIASFEQWDLRHRILLQEDWNGDGRRDLVRLHRLAEDRIQVRLHLASPRGTEYRISEDTPAASTTIPGPITGYAARSVRGLGPVVLLHHESAVTLVHRR